MASERSHWGSRIGFVLAASGSAIGLGNIWKFPYITGQHGGGAFVLVYLCAIFMIGFPLLVAEVHLGRASQESPVQAFIRLGQGKRLYGIFGWLVVVTAFVLLSYYSVVAGWTLDYIVKSVRGAFAGQEAEAINGMFGVLNANAKANVGWHLLFMGFGTLIILLGVKRGIERWSKVLMSALFVLISGMVVYAMVHGAAIEGLRFLFRPDFEKLTAASFLEAVGHAFFTLSLGMGAMITYGSYLRRDDNIVRSSIYIVVLDTLIALLACAIIFPIVFAHGMEPAAGPGLVFKTLPIIFSQIPYGGLIATLFFVLLSFAALTSAISLYEVVVATIIDGWNWQRRTATLVVGSAVASFGLISALSGSVLSDVHLIGNMNPFDSFDYVVSNIMLPLGGLSVSLFMGWVVSVEMRKAAFTNAGALEKSWKLWSFVLRYVAPATLVLIFLNVLDFF